MKMYISGPMSGYADYNYPAFFDAEYRLKIMGYDVANPAHNDVKIFNTRAKLMREDIRVLACECDSIVFIPGWMRSIGALTEARIAWECEMSAFVFESKRIQTLKGDWEDEWELIPINLTKFFDGEDPKE